jgi:hypothetical protein
VEFIFVHGLVFVSSYGGEVGSGESSGARR